ncbi:MAG: hypothetical protein QXL94_07035 [Candidatus Parvarchaeum sp.]
MNETLIDSNKETTEQKTAKVKKRLLKRYHEELCITEFKDAPSNADHRADMLVIYLHPSRGKLIEYFEIKASRGDWLKELSTPSKSDKIARSCDKIWLVTADEEVARLEEIPETWGWMYLKGQQLKIKKEAPKQEPVFDKDFVITVAQYSSREFNQKLMAATDKAYEEAKIKIEDRYSEEYWKREAKIDKENYQKISDRLESLDKILGLDYVFARENKDEVMKAGALLASILKVNDTLSGNSTEIEWFEKDMKRLEENIKEVRNAIKALRQSEITTINPTEDINEKQANL